MATSLAPADLDALAQLLERRIGLRLPPSRHPDLLAATQKVLARHRLATSARPVEVLASNARALEALVSAITIGETYFFRDASQLDLLRERVIPQLRAMRGPGHVLRLWSAGCASGEEAYTLAALMQESGAGPFRVLGTDVCNESLERARRASYGEWSLRGEGRQRMSPFLQPAGDRWSVLPVLGSLVEFRPHNLAVAGSGWSALRGMDLILCRNVLIYFGAETVSEVAARLFDCLAPGGVLLAGPSDPLLGPHAGFATEITPHGLAYRRQTKAAGGKRADETSSQAPAAGDQAEPSGADARMAPHVPVRKVASSESRGAAGPARPARRPGRGNNSQASPPDTAGDPLAAPYREAMHRLANGDAAIAEKQLRRLLYLDRRQPVLHFGLGVALIAQGRVEAARRALRNAAQLASEISPEQPVQLGYGATAGQLAQAAKAHLAALPAHGG